MNERRLSITTRLLYISHVDESSDTSLQLAGEEYIRHPN